MSGPFEIAGLLTHLLVLALGAGGTIGLIPLARERRAGAGLLLMAISMGLVMLEPRLQLGLVGAVAYSMAFLTALWLLLGPDQRKPRAADRQQNTCRTTPDLRNQEQSASSS